MITTALNPTTKKQAKIARILRVQQGGSAQPPGTIFSRKKKAKIEHIERMRRDTPTVTASDDRSSTRLNNRLSLVESNLESFNANAIGNYEAMAQRMGVLEPLVNALQAEMNSFYTEFRKMPDLQAPGASPTPDDKDGGNEGKAHSKKSNK